MSVSFWCPEAPTKEVRPYRDEPDLVETVSTLPECDFTSANAAAVLRAAGLPTECWGEWKNDELPAVQSALLRLVNSANARKVAVRQTTEWRGQLRATGTDGNVVEVGRGPTFISCGMNDEGVRSRAARLMEVVDAARRFGGSVTWG